MENYIVTIYDKEDYADEVGEYYKGLQSKYESAPGFISRKIFRAKNGAMAAAVKATYSEEELAAVLGHEIGHVTARHSVRQYSQSQLGIQRMHEEQ